MEITKKEVEYVAALARIEFDDTKLERFTAELQDIIGFFDKLNELEINEDVPLYQMPDNTHDLREDIVLPSIPRKDILLNAPEHDDTCIIVPSVVE
jgi:aspartyl-tRNA(Asn)/glutamyl-tRNA(Gln) amidotransferase subunit C